MAALPASDTSAPARRLARTWTALRRNRAGTVAVEFAMVGGLCVLLIIETMQAGLYFYASASLERATAKAMRQVMTGGISSQSMTAAQFRTNILCPLLPAAMPCASIITNIRSVSEDVSPNGFYTYVNADQSGIVPPTMDNAQTSFCTGSTGSIIYAQIYYAMPVMSPAWRAVGSTTWNGTLVHWVSTAAAFKNEPFQGNSGGC